MTELDPTLSTLGDRLERAAAPIWPPRRRRRPPSPAAPAASRAASASSIAVLAIGIPGVAIGAD